MNKKVYIGGVIGLLALIPVSCLLLPNTTIDGKVINTVDRSEISAEKYDSMSDFIEYDPDVRTLAKRYFNNDGFIDEAEYRDIGNKFVKDMEDRRRKKLREQFTSDLKKY